MMGPMLKSRHLAADPLCRAAKTTPRQKNDTEDPAMVGVFPGMERRVPG